MIREMSQEPTYLVKRRNLGKFSVRVVEFYQL